MSLLDDSGNGGGRRKDWWKRSAFPVVLAAALGALGGGPGYRALDNPRPDPARGRDVDKVRQDMREVDRRLLSRIEGIEQKHGERMDRMETRQISMNERLQELPPDKLLERVTRLEEKYEWLQRSTVHWAHPSPQTTKRKE